MTFSYENMNQIDTHIDTLELDLVQRCLPYANLINLLIDIPGISYISAIAVIAEIGIDMSVFKSSKQLTCWAGLAHSNNESSNKKISVRISRAGTYLKPLLIQCALSAIKSTSNPYYRIKYNTIKKRRGHKKAIVAIARMILVNIYAILSTGEVYNPCDFKEVTSPKPAKKEMTIENALFFLQAQGIDTSALVLNVS